MESLRRAFAYARISGAHTQTELSIKEQLIQIHRYAEKNTIHIEKEYTEICSAFRTAGEKQLTARKVFFDMLASINSKIDCILIFRYDRASRTGKEFVLLEERCSKYGVEIISITESFGQEKWPLSNFLVRNSINLSQLYSEELSFKCRLWMVRAMKEGKLPGSILPYGYIRLKKNVAIIDESVRSVIREIFERYATGNETYMGIAEKLRLDGVLNRKWLPITWKDVEWVLKNETYTGFKTMKWYLKKYEVPYYEWATKAGTFIERYRLNLEPIISEELYQEVTKIRSGRNNYGPSKTESRRERIGKQKVGEHIFSGFIQCACGRHFVGQLNRKRNIMYYGCSRSITKRFPEMCHEPYIQEQEVFKLIKDSLWERYLTPGKLQKFSEALDIVFSKTEAEREGKREIIFKQIKELEKKQVILTEKFVEGKISEENYELLNQKLQDEKILFEIEEKHDEKIIDEETAKRKIFAHSLWQNWLIEEVFRYFEVSVSSKRRIKMVWTGANLVLGSKKPLTLAINGFLNIMVDCVILKWLRRYESNVRPQGYEPCELPLLYSAI